MITEFHSWSLNPETPSSVSPHRGPLERLPACDTSSALRGASRGPLSFRTHALTDCQKILFKLNWQLSLCNFNHLPALVLSLGTARSKSDLSYEQPPSKCLNNLNKVIYPPQISLPSPKHSPLAIQHKFIFFNSQGNLRLLPYISQSLTSSCKFLGKGHSHLLVSKTHNSRHVYQGDKWKISDPNVSPRGNR